MSQALIDRMVAEAAALRDENQSDHGYRGVPQTFEDPDVHYLVRVYPNMSARHSVRRGDQSEWVAFNLANRGNALFVDGRCVAPAFMSPEDVSEVEAVLRAEMAEGVALSEDTPGPQVDRWGISESSVDRYVGYRPERERADLRVRPGPAP